MDINVSAADLKVISTINDIQEAIDNGDERKLEWYINLIASNVRELLKDCKKQSIGCLILKILNKVIFELTKIDTNVYLEFNDSLVQCANELEYEKYVLNELRKYLKNSNRNREYDNLILAFAVLLNIAKLCNDSCEKVRTSSRVWTNNINGINYIPLIKSINRDEIMSSIDNGLNVLKRKK